MRVLLQFRDALTWVLMCRTASLSVSMRSTAGEGHTIELETVHHELNVLLGAHFRQTRVVQQLKESIQELVLSSECEIALTD